MKKWEMAKAFKKRLPAILELQAKEKAYNLAKMEREKNNQKN